MSDRLAEARALRGLGPEFLQQYNRPGPRYTSYPTAPEWKTDVTASAHRARLRERCGAHPEAPLSLYFHIPFCEHHCRFCACNTIATPRREVADPYLRDLDAEMAIVSGDLDRSGGRDRPVTQLHFGGGTPTYLTPEQITWLMGRIREHFTIAPGAEVSMEIDPCVTSDDHMHTLRETGFNRVSFGIQDFHRPTQEIIERVQSIEETEHLIQLSRTLGFDSVNVDLIYGLPLQTAVTLNSTLDEVLRMRPDRVALYNFAYLPRRLGNQRQIDPALLPTGEQKFEIFITAFERFGAAGYEFIGMDHFAVPDDPLAEARRNHTIQRNFMGYTTQAGTDLLGFGVSSISATDILYAQNTKKLSTFADVLAGGDLPIERGIILSEEDCLRRTVIYELMCHGQLDKISVGERFAIDFDSHFAAELAELEPMVGDGLLHLHPNRIDVTVLGTIFVRNIGMVFDTYLRRPKPQTLFSRTL